MKILMMSNTYTLIVGMLSSMMRSLRPEIFFNMSKAATTALAETITS